MAPLARALVATACLAPLLLTACGSTVVTGTTLGAGSQSGLAGSGLSQPGDVQSGANDGSALSGVPAGATPATADGASSSGNVLGTATGGRTGGGTSATAGALRAGDGKPVTIGVITSGNAGAFASTVGLNVNFGDQRAQAQVIADYLNAHGGLLGHKVQLTFYDYDASAGNDGNAQAACTAFTEDRHAFAAIGIAGMADAYHACAAKHGMLVLSNADIKSASFFRKFPTTILISDVELTRKYRAMVPALKSMGFFAAGAKVGLIYSDDPNDVEAIRQGMKPALASIGFSPIDEIAVNSNDSGQYASQLSASVLKLRADGVTHIVFGNAAAWLFAQSAEQQRYYPKMGIDSRQSPGLLMQTADSPDQLVNVMGIGFQPIQDVDASHDPGPVSDRQRLCQKLYKDAGQSSDSARLATAAALYICDELFFLRDALAGRRDLSRDSFLGGVAGLGSTYHSTLTFGTRFSAGQHDGAQVYRQVRFESTCSCFVYVGPMRLFS